MANGKIRKEILQSWRQLSEEEKAKILPKLLVATKGWRDWTFSPPACLTWLELKFQQAGVPFPQEASLSEKSTHRAPREPDASSERK